MLYDIVFGDARKEYEVELNMSKSELVAVSKFIEAMMESGMVMPYIMINDDKGNEVDYVDYFNDPSVAD